MLTEHKISSSQFFTIFVKQLVRKTKKKNILAHTSINKEVYDNIKKIVYLLSL